MCNALPQIFTALSAARRHIEERSWRPFLFLPDVSLEDFDGVEVLADPASASDETLARSCVVVGLAPEHFHYEKVLFGSPPFRRANFLIKFLDAFKGERSENTIGVFSYIHLLRCIQ